MRTRTKPNNRRALHNSASGSIEFGVSQNSGG